MHAEKFIAYFNFWSDRCGNTMVYNADVKENWMKKYYNMVSIMGNKFININETMIVSETEKTSNNQENCNANERGDENCD